MKIQITPNKIVPDALVVWNKPGPEVDIVMDIKNLTFKENSLDEIYAFHILDHLFISETQEALSNWRKCLKLGGFLHVIVNDFEFLARAFVGTDITLDQFNVNFINPAYFDRETIIKELNKAGFLDKDMRIWFSDVPYFDKQDFEIVIEATKI